MSHSEVADRPFAKSRSHVGNHVDVVNIDAVMTDTSPKYYRTSKESRIFYHSPLSRCGF